MANTSQADNVLQGPQGIAVLSERLNSVAAAVDDIRDRLGHMATKEQVAQLVSRSEFDRQTWELTKLREDMDREVASIRTDIDRNSFRKLWSHVTTIVSGLVSLLALWAAVTGWKP